MSKIKIIENLLTELRESADIIYNIYTKGSCYRLYNVLKAIYPEAVPYWSDFDGHAITKIDNSFYDIGGKLNKKYVEERGYFEVPNRLRDGYSMMKYGDEDNRRTVTPEKYSK